MKRHFSYTIQVDKQDADLLAVITPRNIGTLYNRIARRALGPKPKGYHVDHINDDWRDNRRKNLHYIPARENLRKNVTGLYYGVTSSGNRFKAVVRRNAKNVNLGSYMTEIDAAYAVDNYLRSVGEKPVNFPDVIGEPVKAPKNFNWIKVSSTGYRGVRASGSKFVAVIEINKKRSVIGRFTDPISAAKAYDKYVIDNKLNKQINFPEGYK